MTPTEIERRLVRYSGRVQGVGFRQAARSVALRYRVTGYVKNLDDGQVELVVEGSPSEIDACLAAIGERMARYIDGSTQRALDATGEFAEFDIRF